MKRPRIRLRWLILMGLVLLPPLLWVLLVSVAPTDWARQRFAARMSAATGRSVRIATVRVGVLGGIYLTGLEIGAPGAADDPWLKVAQAHLNVSPWQLLCGHAAPTRTEVRGISLRVLRRDDGTLELDDLIQGVETAAADVESGRSSCPLSRLDLRIKDALVTVIDAPTRTRLEFRDIEGRATSEGRNATIQELRGTLNGGTLRGGRPARPLDRRAVVRGPPPRPEDRTEPGDERAGVSRAGPLEPAPGASTARSTSTSTSAARGRPAPPCGRRSSATARSPSTRSTSTDRGSWPSWPRSSSCRRNGGSGRSRATSRSNRAGSSART